METVPTHNDDSSYAADAAYVNGEESTTEKEVSLLISDNAQFVETLYRQYKTDPHSVSEEWRAYFAQLSSSPAVTPVKQSNGALARLAESGDLEKQARVLQLINAYRVRGHFDANLDPLGIEPKRSHPELDPAYYGFTDEDLKKEFPLARLFGMPALTLQGILSTLRETYCGSVGIEFRHIQDPVQRRWIVDRVEDRNFRKSYPSTQSGPSL